MTDCQLSVIIPAHNEESRLPRTLVEVILYLEKQPFTSEILVVTDGSTDDTVGVSQFFQRFYPSLTVLSYPKRRGKGFGVKEGMLNARGKARLYMDADSAVPIQFVEPCLEKLKQGYDMAIGSRTIKGSKVIVQQRFPRHELAVAFGFLQRAMLALPIVDTQCGFKLFSAEAVEKYFPLQTLDCAFFDTEILYLAYHTKARIATVPVTWTHDHHTRLPIGVNRSMELVSILFQLRKAHKSFLADQGVHHL